MRQKDITINKTLSLALQNHRKNNFKIAESLYRKILTIDSNHFKSIFLLGSLLMQVKNFDEAKRLLQKVIRIQPDHADAHNNLGLVFKGLGERQKTISYCQKAIEIQPNHADAHNNLGLVFQELREHHKAISYCQKAIEIQPNLAAAHNNLGLVFQELGQRAKAISSYQEATKYETENLVTFYHLSNLKKEVLDLNLKKRINKIMENKNCTKRNIAYGNFLLSKYELEAKNYKKEVGYLLRGHNYYFESKNKKFKKQVKYWLSELPNIIELININKTSKKIKKTNYNINPIFIIGVPRCGSTLVEKVIASSSRYIPIGEETEIINFFVKQKIQQKKSLNSNIENLQKKIINKYKQKKLIQKKHNYTFTDKSLDNFFFISLIKEIFPYAKVINCKRNPLSSIISILKNNLVGISWAHDLNNIFKYFDIYYQMIKKFKKNYPNFIYDLEFEKFISNPDIESKKLLKFCNIPWHIKCLKFYKRKDLISQTASNIQIQKGIYKDSNRKYLPYKKFLNKYGNKYNWFN